MLILGAPSAACHGGGTGRTIIHRQSFEASPNRVHAILITICRNLHLSSVPFNLHSDISEQPYWELRGVSRYRYSSPSPSALKLGFIAGDLGIIGAKRRS